MGMAASMIIFLVFGTQRVSGSYCKIDIIYLKVSIRICGRAGHAGEQSLKKQLINGPYPHSPARQRVKARITWENQWAFGKVLVTIGMLERRRRQVSCDP